MQTSNPSSTPIGRHTNTPSASMQHSDKVARASSSATVLFPKHHLKSCPKGHQRLQRWPRSLWLHEFHHRGTYPGSPGVKNLPANVRDTCSIPGPGTNIPHGVPKADGQMRYHTSERGEQPKDSYQSGGFWSQHSILSHRGKKKTVILIYSFLSRKVYKILQPFARKTQWSHL